MGSDGSVIDASAALALVHREPGYEAVQAELPRRVTISSVNLAEVHSTLLLQGVAAEEILARLKAVGLEVEPFDEADSAVVGRLRPMTKPLGLSLADRACLALGLRLGRPVLTADRALARADIGVAVQMIR